MTDSEQNDSSFPLWTILFSVSSVVACAIFYYFRESSFASLAEIGFVLSGATAISIVIWQACDPFAEAAQWVGKRLRIPTSVRGATLDAIASSMPELFTGLFFVTLALTSDKSALERLQASAEGYGSTIATCAGSSIYNMILIPAVCAIAISLSRRSRPHIDISKDVLKRDGNWVLAMQFGLLVFLFQPKLSWWMGVVALLAYAVYVLHLYVDTRRYQKQLENGGAPEISADDEVEFLFGIFRAPLNGLSATVTLVVSTLVAATACYFLVTLTRSSAEHLGVPEFFVAVILTAAVSSIPDTFVSLGSARRGDDSGAMSNVFGSNIFDICIGMSIPLLVSCYLNDWEPISLIDDEDKTLRGVVGLRVFLFVLTVIAMGTMWRTRKITSGIGKFFVLLYGLFVAYAILGALGIIPA